MPNAMGLFAPPPVRRPQAGQREDAARPHRRGQRVKRVGEHGARSAGVTGYRKRHRREHGQRRDEWHAPYAQQERRTLQRHPNPDRPPGRRHQESKAAGERGGKRNVHRRIDPGNLRSHARETPDDQRSDSAQQPEVLEPVERRQDEVRLRR